MTLNQTTKLIIASIYISVCLASPAQAHAEFLRPDLGIESSWHENGSNLAPVISFFLPGFDQFRMGEFSSGVVYSGLGIGGLALAAGAVHEVQQSEINKTEIKDYTKLYRQYAYGSQLYMFAGEMSAYHSFMHTIHLRQRHGDYAFIKKQDDPADLFLAPFQFKELLKPSTFVPLAVLAALGAATIANQGHSNFDAGDLAFTAGTSYNAGVGEEALFRGFIMPSLRQTMGSDQWSNITQAAIFGLAHYSPKNRFPIFQAGMGYYLGMLAMRNDWSLQQSIFLHAWWDVLALGIQFAASNKIEERVIRLPEMTFTF